MILPAQDLGQHRLCMLTQRGWRGANSRATLTVLDGRADELDGPAGRVVDFADHAAREHVLVLQCVLDVVDGRIGHAGAVEEVEPLLGGLGLCDGLDHGFELGAVLHASLVGHEAVVRLPLGLAEFVADDAEEPVVAAAEHDVAVRGREPLVRHDAGVRRAPASAVALAADQHAARDVGQRRNLTIGECDVEVLAGPDLFSRQ